MPTKKQLERQLSMANDALEAALSLSPERDNNFFTGGLSDLYTGRNEWDRKKIFAESIRAWRVNPIARRIVRLQTSFAIGKGLTLKSADPKIQTFLQAWWNHPLNQFNRNVKRWKDEDTRAGNLFLLFSIQPDNLAIIRAVPAEQIEEIQTSENDIEQEIAYLWKDNQGNEITYPAYQPDQNQTLFMRHYASNQPVGSPWGEADLSPLLVWIGRFSAWLENRARLNQFRTAFMYVVTGSYSSESERATREKQLMANPPKSGSVLVMNSNAGEEWGILSANLDAFDASMDGTSLKKMIMNGIGHPMHWHAEGESAISTTAEAAGTPTFRTLEEMQNDFFEMLIDLARIALQVKGLPSDAKIWIEGPDITERDNATLALALGRAYPQLADLFDREGIDSKEFMRLVYKTFAEVWDDTQTPDIKRKPLVKPVDQAPAIDDAKTDPGDPKESLAEQLFDKLDQFSTRDALPAPVQNMTFNIPPSETTIHIPPSETVIQNQNNLPALEQPTIEVFNTIEPAPPSNLNVTVKHLHPKQNPVTVNVTNQIDIPETEESLVVERDSEGRAAKIRKTTKRRKSE